MQNFDSLTIVFETFLVVDRTDMPSGTWPIVEDKISKDAS